MCLTDTLHRRDIMSDQTSCAKKDHEKYHKKDHEKYHKKDHLDYIEDVTTVIRNNIDRLFEYTNFNLQILGYDDITLIFLSKKSIIKHVLDNTVCIKTTEHNCYPIVFYLIDNIISAKLFGYIVQKHHLDCTFPGIFGQTPWLRACSGGTVEIIEYLYENNFTSNNDILYRHLFLRPDELVLNNKKLSKNDSRKWNAKLLADLFDDEKLVIREHQYNSIYSGSDFDGDNANNFNIDIVRNG